MQTIWLSPTDFVSGDPTLHISYPSVSSPNTTITCTTCTTPGDFKWVSMGLRLPEENVKIEEIIVCYQISNPQSFISQIRITEMREPDKAFVIHDESANLQSITPVCYPSNVGGKAPTQGTAVTLALRLNFQNTNDKIMLGAVGVELTPQTIDSVINVKDFGAWGDSVYLTQVRINKVSISNTAILCLSDKSV